MTHFSDPFVFRMCQNECVNMRPACHVNQRVSRRDKRGSARQGPMWFQSAVRGGGGVRGGAVSHVQCFLDFTCHTFGALSSWAVFRCLSRRALARHPFNNYYPLLPIIEDVPVWTGLGILFLGNPHHCQGHGCFCIPLTP